MQRKMFNGIQRVRVDIVFTCEKETKNSRQGIVS